MKTGVCSYCFNSMLTEGKISLMEAIEFVGKETEADCFEPYSPYWSPDRRRARTGARGPETDGTGGPAGLVPCPGDRFRRL